MRRMIAAAVLLAASAAAESLPAASDPQPQAPTRSGVVRGQVRAGAREFLGIPYAAAPLGRLRWRAPEPMPRWPGVRDATAFGPKCPQSAYGGWGGAQDEDCLFLNIFAPPAPGTNTDAAGVPVMVWIHGGGMRTGSGSAPTFNGTYLATHHGVVVVTCNYRLNVFGFLSSESMRDRSIDRSIGNYGIQDQRAVLEWVQANIANFGGDPARVTIFGESAGGASVLHHLVRPDKSRGLFAHAVMESAPLPDGYMAQPVEIAEKTFAHVLDATGCTDIACLESRSTDELQNATVAVASYAPTIDGVELSMMPWRVLEAGGAVSVPTMLGSNRDEGATHLAKDADYRATDGASLRAWAAETFGADLAPKIAALYPSTSYNQTSCCSAAWWAMERACGDFMFSCPARRGARWLSASAPVYAYMFTHPPADRPPPANEFACHSCEIRYVFHSGEDSPAGVGLADTMAGYWAAFAHAGDPNGEGRPAWPLYSTGYSDALQQLGTERVGPLHDLKVAECDFWDSVAERLSDAGVGFCYPHFPLPQNASKVSASKPSRASIAAAPTATLHHALIKIRPDDKVPDETQITTVSAARNEYQSFQVAVAASGADATVSSIEVAFPSALGADGILVHREHYINISVVSNCAGALGRWPDALIPDTDPYDKQKRNAFPAAVPDGTNQAFFVDLFVKNGTAAGSHAGTVTVHWASAGDEAGQAQPTVLPLTLQVYNFSLPSVSRYATTYNCDSRAILMGRYLGRWNVAPQTSEQVVKWQKQYVDLGLMHRVTFSDFLRADQKALEAQPVDWATVERHWGSYLGSAGAPLVDTPFGLEQTRPTTIQLPPMHYPGPSTAIGGINKTLIDDLWHGTGCTLPTPHWGYAYWSSQPEYGVQDMLTYCKHAAAGEDDKWARACAAKGAKVKCALQPDPHVPLGPVNNSDAIAYWRDVSAHAKKSGWFDRVFDYTCDEPGAGAGRYPVCAARATTIHKADPDYKVMITAEKPSADSVNISDMIDIWVPIINFMDSPAICKYKNWYLGDRRQCDYAGLVAEGKGLWWYQSCMSEGCASAVQPAHGSSSPGCDQKSSCTNGVYKNASTGHTTAWPSYMIDAPATLNRAMSWLSYKYAIQGELYWGTNAADGHYMHPQNSSWETQWLAGGNGDGSLTYPGRPDHIGGSSTVPIASLRLKQLRDGLEDLEYMYLLEDLTGSREAALAIVNTVMRTTYDFDFEDPAAMLGARGKLAEAIERALLR